MTTQEYTDYTTAVTVNGQQIEAFELWNGDEELIDIVLVGHWDDTTAMAATRAYIEGPLTEEFGESPYGNGIGTEAEVWEYGARNLSRGYGRLRSTGSDESVWDWSIEPADGLDPITCYYVGD